MGCRYQHERGKRLIGRAVGKSGDERPYAAISDIEHTSQFRPDRPLEVRPRSRTPNESGTIQALCCGISVSRPKKAPKSVQYGAWRPDMLFQNALSGRASSPNPMRKSERNLQIGSASDIRID